MPSDHSHHGDLPALKRAGLGRRIVSIAYEALLLVPVLFISAYLFLALTQGLQGPAKRPLFQLWLLCVLGAYFVYCWKRGGQTLAMKTWRIRLARRDGAALSTRVALARYLVALPGVLMLGIGFLWALMDPERQFLHDRLCGTRLFDVRPSGAPSVESSATPAAEKPQ